MRLVTGTILLLLLFTGTVEPQFNELLFNEVPVITNASEEEKSPMVSNRDPKQYWNNWKNDMPLFSATNQERPYEQLVHNWHNFVYPSNSKIYGQEPPYYITNIVIANIFCLSLDTSWYRGSTVEGAIIGEGAYKRKFTVHVFECMLPDYYYTHGVSLLSCAQLRRFHTRDRLSVIGLRRIIRL